MEGDDDLIFTDGRVTDPAALAGGGEATDGHAGGATDLAELHTPEAWMDAMLKMNEPLDVRAMKLLWEASGITLQIVRQYNSILQDTYGWSTPLEGRWLHSVDRG